MKIETQALEDRQTKLIAELDSETLEQYKRRAARKIAGQAKIPGFRPGKAPYDVIRRMYGDPALQQEAIEIMLDDIYPQALKEANIDPSGPGKLEEVLSVDPPKFAFIIPLDPEVVLGDYKEMRKEYAPETIGDAEIEKTLVRLQRSYATAEPVERAAQEGDLVSFKMSASRLNAEEGESASLIEESSYQMVAGEEEEDEENQWPYPGFSKELIGLSANESKTWTHVFGEEVAFEDLRGKESEFKLEVQNVKEMHMSALDDEFAKTVGQFETLEDLRKAIRSQLEQNKNQQYDQDYFNDLIEQLVSQATIKYPPHMLEQEVEDFVHGVEHDLEHEHLDLDTYLKMREMDRQTFIDTEVKPAATRRLERSLVLGEFARQEKVEVKEEEIRSIYFTALQQMQQSEEMKKIQAREKRSARDMANSIAANAVNNIFNQRLMDRIKAIATGKGDEPVEAQPETTPELNAAPETEAAVEEPVTQETETAPQETATGETSQTETSAGSSETGEEQA